MAKAKAATNGKDKREKFSDLLHETMFQDAYSNPAARLGFGQVGVSEFTQYPMTRLTRDYNLMNSLYRSNWLAKRVIEVIPNDSLKNWITYVSEMKPEEIDKLRQVERTSKIRNALFRGMCWGRLYGGAAGLMLIDGQEDKLATPLDIDAILPGDFRGLLITDRWAGVYPQIGLVQDINDPDFGLPEFYEFRNWTTRETYTVHHSRIIRFVGSDLPEWERVAEIYWGASIIESVYDEIRKRDNASANISALIFLAHIRVLKMGGLGTLLAGTNNQAQQIFYRTITAQNELMNNMGLYVMDKEDSFESVNYSFEGLSEIYNEFMMDVAGATQIPVTKLFGRSPAGMNATGESDLRNYYDVVENQQETHLRPQIEKLTPVMCMSAFGFIPDDIEFTFNPVHTSTDEEIANKLKSVTDAVLAVHDRGIIGDKPALKEFKQLSDDTGVFSNITDDMINRADEDPVKMDEMMALQEGEAEDPEKLDKLS